jgi:hypothetical protein
MASAASAGVGRQRATAHVRRRGGGRYVRPQAALSPARAAERRFALWLAAGGSSGLCIPCSWVISATSVADVLSSLVVGLGWSGFIRRRHRGALRDQGETQGALAFLLGDGGGQGIGRGVGVEPQEKARTSRAGSWACAVRPYWITVITRATGTFDTNWPPGVYLLRDFVEVSGFISVENVGWAH